VYWWGKLLVRCQQDVCGALSHGARCVLHQLRRGLLGAGDRVAMTKGFQQQIHALLVRQCPCNRAYLAGITYAYVEPHERCVCAAVVAPLAKTNDARKGKQAVVAPRRVTGEAWRLSGRGGGRDRFPAPGSTPRHTARRPPMIRQTSYRKVQRLNVEHERKGYCH